MRASDFIKQGVAEGTNNITYKQQKGNNKFSVEMLVDGKPAGMFQYDANTGRTITELDPAYRGQGLGQQLILKGIYTAAMLGMDYVEDESRTAMFDRALDSLADAGYIVNDEEYWYVTDSGEQFLKQGVISEYSARGRVGTSGPIKLGNMYKDSLPVVNTPISHLYEVRIDNNSKDYPEYYFYNKDTGACVGQFALDTLSDAADDAKAIVKSGVMIVNPHITLAPEVQGKGLGLLIYRTFLSDGNRVFATYGHSIGAGALWNKVATGDIVSVLYNADIKQVVSPNSKESQFAVRILGHKNKFNPDVELTEGWKDWVVGGAMALGALGAQAGNIATQVVNPGDTVYKIARDNGVHPSVIMKLNGFNNQTKLTPGQEVKVPDVYTKDARPAPKAQVPISKSAIAKGVRGAVARAQALKPTEKPVVKAEPKVEPVVKKASVIKVKTVTDNPLEKVVLDTAMKSGITGTELAAFMAQVAHESHDFQSMVEYGGSLDFRKYDPKYAPKKAKELGNKYVGDGNKFKGRGFIQITGRYNYAKASKAIGVDLVKNPKLAEDPAIAAKIAVWFWKLRVQPNVDNWHDVTDVTRPINPGMRGLKDRKENFNDYMELAQADTTANKKEV